MLANQHMMWEYYSSVCMSLDVSDEHEEVVYVWGESECFPDVQLVAQTPLSRDRFLTWCHYRIFMCMYIHICTLPTIRARDTVSIFMLVYFKSSTPRQ